MVQTRIERVGSSGHSRELQSRADWPDDRSDRERDAISGDEHEGMGHVLDGISESAPPKHTGAVTIDLTQLFARREVRRSHRDGDPAGVVFAGSSCVSSLHGESNALEAQGTSRLERNFSQSLLSVGLFTPTDVATKSETQ